MLVGLDVFRQSMFQTAHTLNNQFTGVRRASDLIWLEKPIMQLEASECCTI